MHVTQQHFEDIIFSSTIYGHQMNVNMHVHVHTYMYVRASSLQYMYA